MKKREEKEIKTTTYNNFITKKGHIKTCQEGSSKKDWKPMSTNERKLCKTYYGTILHGIGSSEPLCVSLCSFRHIGHKSSRMTSKAR